LPFEAKLSTAAVGVAIKQTDANWWNGADFSGASPDYTRFTVVNTTTTGASPNTWTTTLPGGFITALISGKSYLIVSRSSDVVGNSEFASNTAPAGAGTTITYDTSAPTATITVPVAGLPGVKSLSTISGTANDDVGVANVKVSIQQQDGTWYDGDGFDSGSEVPLQPTLSPSATAWWYTSGSLNGVLLPDTRYTILAKAYDVSFNTQTVLVVNVS
jgi:hypothetical protein